MSAENAENQQALLASKQRDERSSERIGKLRAKLVKEQKGRLTELRKVKAEYQERWVE